jgi:hypothetical protein
VGFFGPVSHVLSKAGDEKQRRPRKCTAMIVRHGETRNPVVSSLKISATHFQDLWRAILDFMLTDTEVCTFRYFKVVICVFSSISNINMEAFRGLALAPFSFVLEKEWFRLKAKG